MRILGIILIVLGLLGFVFGGFSFTEKDTVAEIGPLEIQTEETHSFPIAPVASGLAMVAGLVLVVVSARKS